MKANLMKHKVKLKPFPLLSSIKLLRPRFSKPVYILDDHFPKSRCGIFSGRRLAEYSYYLKKSKNFFVICPHQQLSKRRSYEEYRNDINELIRAYPELDKRKFIYVAPNAPEFKGKFIYTNFLSSAFRYLRFFERHKMYFSFTLYPGGGFNFRNEKKLMVKLTKIFSSKFFSAVFVHHRIVQQYLIENFNLGDKLIFDDGGFSQLTYKNVIRKNHFGYERQVLNVCFVANKYDKKGLGKGFDIFCEVSKLFKGNSQVAFHLVGDWKENLVENNVTKYGYLNASQLYSFYSQMDIILSPTRSDFPRKGGFDGFPLVVDAGLCGVAMFVTDPLKQNVQFTSGQDIVIISGCVNDIAKRIHYYLSRPKELKALAFQGQRIIKKIRNKHKKLSYKMKMLKKLSSRHSHNEE